MIRKTNEIRLVAVSHDSAVLRTLWLISDSNHWQFESMTNAWEAIEQMQSGMNADLVLLDLPKNDADGLHILRWLRRLRPALPVIFISHPEDTSAKQEAVRMGVSDYLLKPLDERLLEWTIRQHISPSPEVLEAEITSDDIEKVGEDSFFIGIGPVMRKLRAQAVLLAESNVPVLIVGESGSGKETTARLIHKLSVRSGFQFAKVNCAALPSDLLERELFGYRRDGILPRAMLGKLEICSRGTILLEEITEMPIDLQASLLHLLQNRKFLKPGTLLPVDVDARIIAASSESMERAVSENRLREDLYYHLSAYTIQVPPLRERKEELSLLSRHFMHQLAKHYSISPRDFSPAIIDAYQAYSWPGNLRELESFVKRYLMVGDKELGFDAGRASKSSTIAESAVTVERPGQLTTSYGNGELKSDSLKALVQTVKLEAEKNAIAAALEKTGWNRKAAARLLKVSYRTLLYKIEQYQMRAAGAPLLPGSSGLRRKGTGLRSSGETE